MTDLRLRTCLKLNWFVCSSTGRLGREGVQEQGIKERPFTPNVTRVKMSPIELLPALKARKGPNREATYTFYMPRVKGSTFALVVGIPTRLY